MTEMLRTNAPKRAPRASIYLMILVAGILAPYQAAQAITYWTQYGWVTVRFYNFEERIDPVTDVYIYSDSTAIDTKAKPLISSRDPVGEWFYEFVKDGFDCRELPQGGMRFFTNDKGIANGESATFRFKAASDGETEWRFDYFDTASGEWTVGADAKRVEPPAALASEPPKSGREFLLILILVAFAYWFYNDRRKKRGPSDNGPDIK
jgi:hypothetical protein